jgi:hypothetical protein
LDISIALNASQPDSARQEQPRNGRLIVLYFLRDIPLGFWPEEASIISIPFLRMVSFWPLRFRLRCAMSPYCP